MFRITCRALLIFVALAIGVVGVRVGAAPGTAEQYPAPRYPRYLVKPTKDRLLRAARSAARQPGGMTPLGREQSGAKVWVLEDFTQDPDAFEAIRTAMAERGVTMIGIPAWEWLGIPKADFLKRAQANLLFGKDAWKEIGVFEPKFLPFFPKAVQKEFGQSLSSRNVAGFVTPFLEAHPEVTAFYASPGGGNMLQRLGDLKNAPKFRANWVYSTKIDLLMKGSEFPPDVWSLVQDRVEKPRQYVSEGTFTDPQGTRLRWVLTPAQAKVWAGQVSTSGNANATEGAGAGNHLNVYPAAWGATWKEGVIRATGNHLGFVPAMTVTFDERGRVIRVEGGGKNGDLFRMLMDLPKFKNAKFPGATQPGYWYLMQDGFAVNPKFVRDYGLMDQGGTNLTNLSERQRAGVQHFSFSYPSTGLPPDPAFAVYAKAQGLPQQGAHTAHMHVYFTTLKYRLADTGEWITIADKGRVTALDDREVRALTARYGNADEILRYDWIPEIPGVNAPGDPKVYDADPWAFIANEWGRIQSGAYGHYVEDYEMKGGVLDLGR